MTNKSPLLLLACLLFSAVLTAQNVGISDQLFTPQSPLHIYRTTDGNLFQAGRSTAANTGFQLTVTGTNNFQLINRQNGYTSFFTNNTERMRIAAGGYVGINTTNPLLTLDVRSTIGVASTEATPLNFIKLSTPTGSSNANIYFHNNTKLSISRLSDYSNGLAASADAVTIDGPTLNVGIGIDPTSKLHVNDPSVRAASTTWGAAAATTIRSENSELAMGLHNASPWPYWIQARTNGSTARNLSLQPSGGNIGIGTLDPTQRLHVQGNFRLQGAFMPNNNAGTTDQILVSKGAGANPAWGPAFGNMAGITGIGKYFVPPFNINNNTYLTLTITDPQMTMGSTVSWSLFANPNLSNAFGIEWGRNFTILAEPTTGAVKFYIRNTTGYSFTNLQMSYVAYYN